MVGAVRGPEAQNQVDAYSSGPETVRAGRGARDAAVKASSCRPGALSHNALHALVQVGLALASGDPSFDCRRRRGNLLRVSVVERVPKTGGRQSPRAGSIDEPAQAASEQRLAEVRQAHLRQLQPVLRTDAEKLSEIGRRIRAEGRVTDIHKDRSDNAVELKSLFVSDRVLSGDLQNHYAEYSRAKERLRRNVSDQEEEFRKASFLVMGRLSLPPGAEHRRQEVAWSLLEKCLEKGPGMTLTMRPGGYQYTARGRSRGYDDTTVVAEDERAAFEAFTSFLPDADVAAHCESLKNRAAGISANAKKLSTNAIGLAQGTTLPGECTYTKRE